MPILRVTRNGQHLCTVGSADVSSIAAQVWGDIWGPEISYLDVTGGRRRTGEDGLRDFLIWEMACELRRPDRVGFHFEEGSASSPDKRIFDPPRQAGEPGIMALPGDAGLAGPVLQPVSDKGLAWTFSLNGAPAIELAPDGTRQHVSLHLIWSDRQPERLRVSLSKKSLREIRERREGESLFLEQVALGSRIELALR